MTHPLPEGVSPTTLEKFVLSLADDELILGHRDSEWTGYAPILEEDIAFSNIAQDEIGHSLVWYTLYHELTGIEPDTMVFKRAWRDFTCCRFVEYPKGDFAYTVIRQYLFDIAEQVKLESFLRSSFPPFVQIAERLLKEESYHRLHLETLLGRLGNATSESSKRMQAAVDLAFPQSLGVFESLDSENELVAATVYRGNAALLDDWIQIVVPAITSVDLKLPVANEGDRLKPVCRADFGGRRGDHTDHLKALVDDLQKVYKMAPEAKW
jgi:ring-1,2-phenylacetyl-CoA epoxidase subunit PaaC